MNMIVVAVIEQYLFQQFCLHPHSATLISRIHEYSLFSPASLVKGKVVLVLD